MSRYISVRRINLGILVAMFLGSWFPATVAWSQPPQGNSFEQYTTMAHVAAMAYDYYGEIDFSKKAYEFKPLDSLAKEISLSAEKIRDYDQAYDWLQVYLRNPSFVTSQDQLRLCRLQKLRGSLDDCRECLQKVISTTSSKEIIQEANKELAGLDLFSQQRTDRFFTTENLEQLNSLYGENNPQFYDGRLYFTSVRKDVPITEKQKNRAPSVLWSSVWQNNKRYAPSKVSFDFLKDVKEVGDFSISDDGKNYMVTDWILDGSHLESTTLFYYQEGKGLSKIDIPDFDIILDPIQWQFNGQTYFIFSSPTELGDLDLYIAEVTNGTLSKPQSIGDNINTSRDEKSPFILNNVLYFSSNGHESMGGFDLFKSTRQNDKWSIPSNLLYPINTTYDDESIAIDPSESYFVVSSNRIGSQSIGGSNCCNDLFLLKESDLDISVDITTYEDNSDKILAQTNLKLYEIMDDQPVIIFTSNSDDSGKSKIQLEQNKQYELVAWKKGFAKESFNISTQYIQNNKEILTDIRLKKEGSDQTSTQSYILPNLNYPYRETKLNEEARQSLDSLVTILKENPQAKIEILVHSELNGASKKLTQKRAEAISKYLIKSGISSSRLKAKGMGDDQLLYDCRNMDCSLAQQTLNRRVEVIYTGDLQQKTIEKKEEVVVSPPIITISNNHQDFGTIKKGETVSGQFTFTNTGESPLIIELATACVCTKLDWPLESIAPGESGIINFIYDSNLKEGEDFLDEVVVDIIANTEPIVTEAFFKVYIKAP